jgi:hypothetical protein
MAARLGRFTGTGGAYWLGLQRDRDLVAAERALDAAIGHIPLAHAGIAARLTGQGTDAVWGERDGCPSKPSGSPAQAPT